MSRGGSGRVPNKPKTDRSRPAPLKKGQRVAILRLGPQPFFEGWAVIDERAEGRSRYRVRFLDDPVIRERLVMRGWQADPAQVLTVLCRLSFLPDVAPVFSDFFPDDVT